MSDTDRLQQRFWLAPRDEPWRLISLDEWITQTMAAGVRPSTMRWRTHFAEGRLEYVLPKE